MSVDTLRSVEEAPKVSQVETQENLEIAQTEEDMRNLLFAALSDVAPVEQLEAQVPQEPMDIEQGIARFVQLSKAA